MISLATTMALVRGVHVAATISLLGMIGFVAWMLPAAPVVPDELRRRLHWLWWITGPIALLAGTVWFTIQSAVIAGADNLSDALDAIPIVAAHTRFGNVVMVRLGLLAAAIGLVRGGPFTVKSLVLLPAQACHPPLAEADNAKLLVAGSTVPRVSGPLPRMSARPAETQAPGSRRYATLYLALLLIAVALGLQGMIGHAGAAAGAIGDGVVLSEALHLLAAGLWLGSLVPLWLSLQVLAPIDASAVCERFSPIGLACVLVLAGTGFAQGLQLIGSLPALFGTAYGHIALLKITLFLIALVLAALNRLWLVDRLAAGAAGARRHLLVSVCVETCVGVAIVTAAAFMAASPPAAHTTPVWPLSWQFSLIAVNREPDFRREVVLSLAAVGAAVALMAASLLWHRFRLVALAILLLALVLRGPSLKLLTVEAYPTSFEISPTEFSTASIVRGQALVAQNCVACHGPNGEGDGPVATALRIRPADLTTPHIWEHTDGQMFWWLTHGVDGPEGRLAMPGFGTSLSADDRWTLIDYVRAHNAGLGIQQDAAFDVPVRAPAFPVTCAGVTASRMADLRGHAVHVVTDQAPNDDIPPQSRIATVTVNLRDGTVPAFGSCVAADPAAWRGYAVLADLPPDNLAGTEFLIDPDGWLRAVQRPGAAGAWHAGESLIAAIRRICATPIRQPSRGQHEQHP